MVRRPDSASSSPRSAAPTRAPRRFAVASSRLVVTARAVASARRTRVLAVVLVVLAGAAATVLASAALAAAVAPLAALAQLSTTVASLAPPGWPLGRPLVLVGLLGLAGTGTSDAGAVDELIEGVRALASGDRDVTFDLDREDDVGRLADELDDLATSIEARERERRERVAFQTDLLDAIDDVFYVIDREGPHRQWNQTLADVTGYDDAELATMHPLDIFDEADRDRVRESMEEAFETGRARVEVDVVTTDGERIPHEFVASRVEAPEGRPVLAGIARDVTERQEYEERLAAIGESVSRLETAETEAEIAQTVCSIVDDVLDEPLCMTWSYDADADADRLVPVGATDPAAELTADVGDGPLVLEADSREMEIFREGEPRVIEDYGAWDGATYPETPVGTILKVPMNRQGMLVVGYRDVRDVDPTTRELVEVLAEHAGASLERVEREERLARYKRFTDDVVDAIDDVFYVVDEDRRMQRWNETLRDVKGYDDEEVASMHPREFFVEEDRDAVEAAMAECFETGSARVEARVRTKAGEEIPYEFRASTLQDPEGEEVLVGIGRDVSEREERQRQLRQARDTLAEHNRTLQRLYEIGADREASLDDKIQRVLELGRERLGTDGAFLSTIDRGGDEFEFTHTSGEAEGLNAGASAPFSETYCRKTFESGEVIDVYDARAEGWTGDPAFERWNFGQYVGGAVYVEGELAGTIGFVEVEPTDRPFTEYHRTFVELASQWLGFELERRRHERDLARYREFTDDISNAIDELFYVVGDGLELHRWNDAVPDATGYDDEQIASMHALEFFPEEDHEVIEEAVEEVWETGSTRCEARLLTEDGETVPYEFSGSALEDPDGNRVLAGIGRDVTERKERQRRLEALVQNTTDPIYIKDREGRYQFVNRAAAENFDLDPEDVIGKTDEELFGGDVAADVRVDDEHVLETGERLTEEVVRPIDGEEYVLLDQKYPFRDEEGRIVGVMGISRDITEQKRREQELSRLVSNVPGLVYRMRNEPEWPTEFVSEGVREITGYDREQLEGGEVTWGEDIIAERNEQIWEQVQDALAEREPFTLTYPIETADGERRWVKEQGRGVFDEDGDLEFLEGVVIDVTDRVEYERELEARNAAMDATIDGIAILDEDERHVFANQAYAGFYGYDEPEAVHGESWTACYPDDEVDRLESSVLWELAETGSWRGEAVGQRADGSTFPQELSLTLLDDGRYVAVVRDISDRKDRERELERNRALLQQAQRVARIGGWELDLGVEPPEMTWTDQLYDIHDVEPGTEIDLDLALEFYHPEDRDRIGEIMETAIEEGQPYDMEVRLDTGGDPERWIRAIAEPVEADGEVVALRGSIQEITTLKRRERELERTRDLLQQAERMGGLGGWELRVDEEPYVGTWTEGLSDIYATEHREEVTLEEVLEHVHPQDQRWVRSEVRRGFQSGQPFSLEHRIVDGTGDVKWLRVVAEPVDDAGELYRGAMLDVTEQKERELILQSLHDAARGLLQTGRPVEVADLAIDTVQDVLDVPCVAVYLLDDETGHLGPVATSDAFEEYCGELSSSSSGAGESLLWKAYVSESPTTLSESNLDTPGIFDEPVTECVYVPIGDHGVLVLASPEYTIDPGARRVAETLAATMEAALGRLDSETDLLEREAELEEQNRQLRRQIQVNEIIRSVDQSLIGASSRDDIEAAVCERLTHAEEVAFAWIGSVDASEDAVVPRSWAGAGGDYLDAVSLSMDADPADAAVRTARSGEPTVVSSVVEGVKDEEWRKHALVSKFSSVVAVPITFEDYTYGVLAVYGTEPGQFGDLERAVFEELGESIANSINAVETRQAIYADTFVELTLGFEGAEDFLARVARETDATVEYVGLGTHSEDESRVFFEVVGADPDAVSATLEDTVAAREYRVIGRTGEDGGDGDGRDDRHLFEATVAGEVLAARLVRRGGVPRAMTATADRLEATVDVPATIDVREFVETLREEHPDVELVARRDVQRDVETRQELVGSLFDELTERQLEVLRTAYFAGFFGWPRESTGEDIAELLDVSQPTVNRHVRHGLQRLLEQLFEEEPATVAEAQ